MSTKIANVSSQKMTDNIKKRPGMWSAVRGKGEGIRLIRSNLNYQGDWIIRGVKGEFYPCKPDIFAATYEPVSD